MFQVEFALAVYVIAWLFTMAMIITNLFGIIKKIEAKLSALPFIVRLLFNIFLSFFIIEQQCIGF